jgi:hypothetical protein
MSFIPRKRQKLEAQNTPFVFFGTALPPLDPEIRDDGTFVPLWQQEVGVLRSCAKVRSGMREDANVCMERLQVASPQDISILLGPKKVIIVSTRTDFQDGRRRRLPLHGRIEQKLLLKRPKISWTKRTWRN